MNFSGKENFPCDDDIIEADSNREKETVIDALVHHERTIMVVLVSYNTEFKFLKKKFLALFSMWSNNCIMIKVLTDFQKFKFRFYIGVYIYHWDHVSHAIDM